MAYFNVGEKPIL